MKTTNKIHYVYKITNLNPTDERLYYIGVKSSFNPLTDNYMGSSKYLDESMKEIGIENFKKEVLSTWNTRKLAMQEEIRLHEEFDVACNILFYNKSKAKSDKFSTEGHVSVIDSRDNKTKNVTQSQFLEFVFYKHAAKGTVVVIDTRDKMKKRVSTTDYKEYDYYQSITNDKVVVIKNGINTLISSEQFQTNDCESIRKNRIIVFDERSGKYTDVNVVEYHNDSSLKSKFDKDNVPVIIDNQVKMISSSEYKNGNYIHKTKGKVPVLDLRDNTFKQIDKIEFINNKDIL